jgi:hypothetical protein
MMLWGLAIETTRKSTPTHLYGLDICPQGRDSALEIIEALSHVEVVAGHVEVAVELLRCEVWVAIWWRV